MSSPSLAVVKPQPRLLTPEASNVLGFWWLAIVTTIVLLCAMWPSIFAGNTTGITPASTYLLVIISATLLAVGAWVGSGFSRGQAWSASAMRLITLIGLVVGLVGVGYFLYSVAFAAETPGGQSFFGPTGVLSGTLWTLMIILPFIFGLTLIFGLMNDAIDEWFNPPVSYEHTDVSLTIDPETAAAMAGSSHAVVMGDEALMGDLSAAMSSTGKARKHRTEKSMEAYGSADDDLSVEVIGGKDAGSDSMAELAALEEALTKDASKKIPGRKTDDKKKKKEEKKYEAGKGDEPLAVDDDFKL